MLRKDRKREMAKLPSVFPAIASHLLGVALALAALAGLAYETGQPARTRPSRGLWHSVLTTIAKPAVAIPVATVLVVGLVAGLRRLWLERLAIKPGRIQVQDFAKPPDVSDVDVAQLARAFRSRLMQMRLQAPTPIPGTTPARDLLQMLDDEHLDAKNPIASMVSVLRAAIPTHAYEVSVALLEEPSTPPAKPRRGVTVQVTRLPNEAIPIDTAWASSWDEAVLQAADMVTAAVLPRTRLSHSPPWSGWRGYPMPSLLVHHFERAQELTSIRRYDEALKHYFRALDDDPKSVDLRLNKGFVEEKLGLYLDAAATYAAARKIAGETSRRIYSRRAIANRQATGYTASYRLAVLLGGVKFAHQWRKQPRRRSYDSNTLRDEQRLVLRERLVPELQELLTAHGLMTPRSVGRTALGDLQPPWHQGYIDGLLEQFSTRPIDDTDPHYYALRRVFVHLAQKEISALQKVPRRRRARTGLTPLVLTLTNEWLDLRKQYIQRRLAQLEGRAGFPAVAVNDNGSPGSRPPPGWNPDPGKNIPTNQREFRTWTERYNAACLYALPLLATDEFKATRPEADVKRERSELAGAAVEHLTRAMSSTVSWYAAQRRDWVLSEDPDLNGLRLCDEFKHFEAIYFPSASRVPTRPRGILRWEQSHYTERLLAQTARRWETTWHQRRDAFADFADPHVIIQWCADEAKAWELVDSLARDYRHWRVRYELIAQMSEWSDRYAFAPLDVELPRFAASSVSRDLDDDKALYKEITWTEAKLHELVSNLSMMKPKERAVANRRTPGRRSEDAGATRGAVVLTRASAAIRLEWLTRTQLERLQRELRDRDFWHRTAPRLYLPYVCDVHAAMWQRLHEWMEDAPHQRRDPAAAFACAMAQASHFSGTFGGMWMLAAADRRLRMLSSGTRDRAAKADHALR